MRQKTFQVFFSYLNFFTHKIVWPNFSASYSTTHLFTQQRLKKESLYVFITVTLFWLKIRFRYYVCNWVYTTNHKRIAVNYFWFVILSGIVGMVLATLIRLEFAYPGVGVFAGDSLQYLSLASAHGVIMVFFMIMPLLFGAFANFLLPTQLGVHDVAFPRLNSAAFWFLPGGLLMLCQLVCVDRRYQRMNVFNIREVQALLKRKFFTDLINTQDYRLLLDKTAIGLRFKLNHNNPVGGNVFAFSHHPVYFTPRTRLFEPRPAQTYTFTEPFPPFLFGKNNSRGTTCAVGSQNQAWVYLNTFYLEMLTNVNTFSLTTCSFFFYPTAFFNPTSLLSSFPAVLVYFYQPFILLSATFFDFYFFMCFATVQQFLSLAWLPAIVALPERQFNRLLELTPPLLPDFVVNTSKIFYPTDWRSKPFGVIVWEQHETITEHIYWMYTYVKIFIHNLLLVETLYPFIETYVSVISDVYRSVLQFTNLLNFLNYETLTAPAFLDKPALLIADNWRSVGGGTTRAISEYCRNHLPPLFDFQNDLTRFLNDQAFTSHRFNFTFNTRESVFEHRFIAPSPLTWQSFLTSTCGLSNLLSGVVKIFQTVVFNIKASFKFYTEFCYYWLNWITPSFAISNFLNDIFFFGIQFTRTLVEVGTFIRPHFIDVTVLRILEPESNVRRNRFFSSPGTHLRQTFFYKLSDFLLSFSEGCYRFLYECIAVITAISFFPTTLAVFTGLYNILALRSFRQFFDTTLVKGERTLHRSEFFTNQTSTFRQKYLFLELAETSRNLRFFNPTYKYDYKAGDYFPKLSKEVNSYLMTTIAELPIGVKLPAWFASESFSDNLFTQFTNFYLKTQAPGLTPSYFTNRFNFTSPLESYFFLFYTTALQGLVVNFSHISVNSLNHKFYRMFATSSFQQRINANWRQLKFTREAWRCKLLAARHQKNLFKRSVHEDGIFWSIERNAKDLLPGWAMITPFSSRTRFTAIGKTDIGLMGVLLVLNSSIISSANFLVTYRYLSTLNNRKMRDARAFFTEGVMVSSWMMIAANPMLIIGIIMLLSDRHWQTSFFDYSGGGDTILFQHMFWFFGHPEVYIIIIPTFGFTNTMLSYYLKKRVSARASLMYSMYTIAFLGFFVWGHHMYMVGLSHTTRMLFSTLTVMISVPAATKIMHWCVTIVNSSFATELPLLFSLTFIFFFISGGISGMCVAHTGMDVLFHDTFYVIGHFHVMLAGAGMFSSFGGFYFYFPAIFGVKYSRIYAYLHYTYYLVGQLMTVIPMFWLGYAGMPRRVLDYPASLGGWHSVASAGHMLSVAGLMAFFIMIFDSLRQARAATRNTFGISRYNTRLNFYLYELARTVYVQQKGWFLAHPAAFRELQLSSRSYRNYELLETTIFSYTFFRK